MVDVTHIRIDRGDVRDQLDVMATAHPDRVDPRRHLACLRGSVGSIRPGSSGAVAPS